jgi:hypothetical protein
VSEWQFTGMTSADVEAWCALYGVTLVEDYLGRAAVTLADAYKIRDVNAKAELGSQQQAQLRARIYTAQQARQETFDDAFARSVANKRVDRQALVAAQQAAWDAVAESEKDLPREVRDALGGVRQSYPTVRPI